MIVRPIIDAGPGLNFFSVQQERLLFGTLGALSVPEAVEQEILQKSQKDPRFYPAQRVWKKLPNRLMTVLSDDYTELLATAVERVSNTSFAQRLRMRNDLGEIMVTAHASVKAEA